MDQSSQVPELLPCPFCEGPANLFKGAAGTWVGECPSDECPGNGVYDTQGEAAAAWNNRPAIAAERAAADRRVAEAVSGATLRYIRIHALRRAITTALDLLRGDELDRRHAVQVLNKAIDTDTADSRASTAQEARNVK